MPGAKSVADLLIAYGQNPGMFSDSIGIPESGNGVPDVLDEARYELEWMLKMQDSETGGVHHKVSCENFPGYVMPENETDELIVTPVSTTATADFCAAMAMAYEYYQNVDQPSQRPVWMRQRRRGLSWKRIRTLFSPIRPISQPVITAIVLTQMNGTGQQHRCGVPPGRKPIVLLWKR